MLLETMENLGVSAQQSLFVGDSLRDQEAAIAAGCRFALVRTGNGAASEARSRALGAHWVGDDLAAFADWLLGGGS
jgi:D-glycero-D-manno-heptose 1,7-bisphosphate phosphatase